MLELPLLFVGAKTLEVLVKHLRHEVAWEMRRTKPQGRVCGGVC